MSGFRRIGALAVALALSVSPARAATTYDTFSGSTSFKICDTINLVAFGEACSFPTDATFDQHLSALPDGTFVNSISGTGGNVVTATKARGVAAEALSVTLAAPLSAIDLTFDYRVDSLSVSGDTDCGVIMSLDTGCTQAYGEARLDVTPPANGHLCADGTDGTTGYPFGFTYFGTTVNGASAPGAYAGGFYLKCYTAPFAAGTTIVLTFTTHTQVSPTGNEARAEVTGRLLRATLAG